MVIWKKINEFDGFLISTTGKCYSLKTNKLLKPQKYPNGYWFYSFKINGVQYTRSIHRLVALAFLPNPENKPQVDHIIPISEGGGYNVENLKWVTPSENNRNPITSKKRSETLKGNENVKKATLAAAIKNKKKTYMYSLDLKLEKVYDSVNDAAEEQGCFAQNISSCCSGAKKQIKGHIWSHEPL